MTPRTVRRAERTVHLIWGVVIALYVYGLLPAWGEPVVRWIVIPGIVGSGFAMWFAAPIRRFVKRHMNLWQAPASRAGRRLAGNDLSCRASCATPLTVGTSGDDLVLATPGVGGAVMPPDDACG